MYKEGEFLNIEDGFLFDFLQNDISSASPIIDKVLALPTLFTLVVLFQGVFGGMGIPKIPNILTKIQNHWLGRFFFCLCIGYTATADIETAVFSTFLFFVIIHLLRTKEEKKESKAWIF